METHFKLSTSQLVSFHYLFWGLATQMIILLVDYLFSGWFFEQIFLIISNYVFHTSTTWQRVNLNMILIFPSKFKSRTICVRPEILQEKEKPPWMEIEKHSIMLTSLLLCICDRHFILCDFCFTFILQFPLWTILIISWFPPCSGWRFSSSLLICTGIWNSIINKKPKKMNNCRIVGAVCIQWSGDAVMVLHLFHNN